MNRITQLDLTPIEMIDEIELCDLIPVDLDLHLADMQITAQRLQIIDLEFELAMARIDAKYAERRRKINAHYNPRIMAAIAGIAFCCGAVAGIVIGIVCALIG